MKLLDKLKNVFFEEVEEDEDEEELPQTFARKVEVPKKKIEQPKKNIDFDFEEEKKEIKNEVKVKEKQEEPIQVAPKVEVEVKKEEEKEKEFPMMFDDDDFLEDKVVSYEKREVTNDIPDVTYKREMREHNDEKSLYQGKREVSYIESVNSRPSYSYTKSYYEEKETKTFKPSPIISPIYGILDKNYHKEEVITKRETRITSNYNKPDLDSVRNKAFGSEEEEKEIVKVKEKPKKEEPTFDDDYKKVYDVNNNKPQVNKVTLADADEYYNDLGLAYNVDYSDASRNTGSRVSKYSPKEKKKTKNNVDDNLFDLIDSMYNKEE